MVDDENPERPRFRFRVTPPVEKMEPEKGYSTHVVVLPPGQLPHPPMTDLPVRMILATVEGHAQGAFATEQPLFQDRPGTTAKHQFAIQELSFPVQSPVDPVTRSSRHEFAPLSLVKPTGASTPHFYQALASNETLTSAIFDCFGSDQRGDTVLAASVRLTGARVASVDFEMPDVRDAFRPGGPSDRISLVFASVEVVFASSTFSGDWS